MTLIKPKQTEQAEYEPPPVAHLLSGQTYRKEKKPMTYTLIAVRDDNEQRFTNLTEADANTLRMEFEKGGCTVSIIPEDE